MSSLSLSRPLPLPKTPRAAAFGQVVLNEARLVRRQPTNMIGSIGLPVVLIIIFGEPPSFHRSLPGYGGLILFDAYVPIIMVLGLTLLALLGLPGPLVSYRELGILRRLSTTPVPPSWLLAAQVVVQLGIALAGLAIVNTVSVVAFGAPVPKSAGGLALSCLLAIGGLFALGLLIAALAPTANSVNAIGRLALFPLMFFAGLWLPRAIMPAVLQDISNYTPLGAAVEAIQDSVQTGFPPAAPLLVLAGYTRYPVPTSPPRTSPWPCARASDPATRYSQACGHRFSRGRPTPAGPAPSSWAPATPTSSGLSSRSTTAAAEPASGSSGRPVDDPPGEHVRDRPEGPPRAADCVRRLAGAAPARVVILGRGAFMSVSSRSTGRGRSA